MSGPEHICRILPTVMADIELKQKERMEKKGYDGEDISIAKRGNLYNERSKAVSSPSV